MADSDDTKGLQERLNKARLDYQASLERQASLEKTNWYLTLGIVLLVVGFSVGGWFRLKSNFAAERVQESLVTHGPEVASQLVEAVTETASEVVPVYYEQVQVQSVQALPEVAMVLDKELAAFGESATEKVKDQLEAALENVHQTQEAAIRKTFPDLTQEQARNLADSVMGSVDEELEGLTGHILAKTVGDIARLDKTLKAADTKDLPNDEAQLSRLMMHHLLLLLDAELMDMRLETPPAEGSKPKPGTTPAKGGK